MVNSVDQIQIAPTEPHKFVLSWSHYLVLMRIKDDGARSFYEVECTKQNWGVRWLQRQDSNVYAAQYELYLPDKKELQAKLKSWIEEFEEQEERISRAT